MPHFFLLVPRWTCLQEPLFQTSKQKELQAGAPYYSRFSFLIPEYTCTRTTKIKSNTKILRGNRTGLQVLFNLIDGLSSREQKGLARKHLQVYQIIHQYHASYKPHPTCVGDVELSAVFNFDKCALWLGHSIYGLTIGTINIAPRVGRHFAPIGWAVFSLINHSRNYSCSIIIGTFKGSSHKAATKRQSGVLRTFLISQCSHCDSRGSRNKAST